MACNRTSFPGSGAGGNGSCVGGSGERASVCSTRFPTGDAYVYPFSSTYGDAATAAFAHADSYSDRSPPSPFSNTLSWRFQKSDCNTRS